MKTRLPTTRISRNTQPHSTSTLAALVEPFNKMDHSRQDLLRSVLQVYVDKNSQGHTDLQKRHKLKQIIEDYIHEEEV